MQNLKNAFLAWLPLGAAIIIICGLSFVGIQQIHRSLLNDPQIDIVRDAVAKLEAGKEPVEVVGRGPDMNEKIDLEKSLSPFVGVYDKNGTPLETNGKIENTPPKPPIGVFEYALVNGEHTVSWQPNKSTRIALVVRPVKNSRGWFVASGRNMSEDEKRIENIFKIYVCSIFFALVVTFTLEVISVVIRKITKNK